MTIKIKSRRKKKNCERFFISNADRKPNEVIFINIISELVLVIIIIILLDFQKQTLN